VGGDGISHPPSPGAAAPQRLLALDVLRAVAVLMVIGRHLHNVEVGPPALAWLLRRWHACGWMGVDLFFVLSGFLVSGLLFSEYRRSGGLRPGRFLGRRAFKIYPGYYLFLLVTWLWVGSRIPRASFLHEVFFIQNYTSRIWNHTWSLAVEEHFYLGLALLLWAMVRWGRGPDPFRALPRVCGAVLGLVFALRLRAQSLHPGGDLLLPTHFRIDALFFGTLLSYHWAFHREPFRALLARFRLAILAGAVALLLPCLLLPLEGSFFVSTVGLTLNYLGFGALVMLAVATTAQDRAPSRWLAPLARVGVYSYSIYLWHTMVGGLCAHYLPPRLGWAATTAAYIAGSVAAGVLTGRLVELPFLRLRDRLLPSRAR
jgi:peptidoglycan/LPS O-acetylase OafA/YrhL